MLIIKLHKQHLIKFTQRASHKIIHDERQHRAHRPCFSGPSGCHLVHFFAITGVGYIGARLELGIPPSERQTIWGRSAPHRRESRIWFACAVLVFQIRYHCFADDPNLSLPNVLQMLTTFWKRCKLRALSTKSRLARSPMMTQETLTCKRISVGESRLRRRPLVLRPLSPLSHPQRSPPHIHRRHRQAIRQLNSLRPIRR